MKMVGRVYGSEPGESGEPVEGHAYVELVGGPLDGQLLDVTGWSPDDIAGGALLITDTGLYGPGGRSDYIPAPGGGGRYVWNGDTP
ncbi:hypothetical protein ACIQV2_33050 [Streptomyces globosus]|uniref:hypothetical protein n=1 Tax=Streptomyces globosus TaxID=68209 RepID=UPI0037F14895